eukprot:g17661.t1
MAPPRGALETYVQGCHARAFRRGHGSLTDGLRGQAASLTSRRQPLGDRPLHADEKWGFGHAGLSHDHVQVYASNGTSNHAGMDRFALHVIVGFRAAMTHAPRCWFRSAPGRPRDRPAAEGQLQLVSHWLKGDGDEMMRDACCTAAIAQAKPVQETTMASIAVVFEIDHAATKPGQSISVVGGHPGMGRWKPERPMGAADRQLATSPGTYPRWIMFSPLWMEHEGTALKLEYKYVKQVSPERFDWEPGPNRSIELRPVPAGSDVWIIRDSQWGGTHLTPTVLNCSLAELNSSRCKVDPNWCPKVKLPPIPKLPLNMDTLQSFHRNGEGPKCVRGADGLGGSFASSDIDSEDSFQPSRTDKQRQRVASSILQQLEAASFTRSPDLNTKAELESLRCENAALRAVLRCLAAGELQASLGGWCLGGCFFFRFPRL